MSSSSSRRKVTRGLTTRRPERPRSLTSARRDSRPAARRSNAQPRPATVGALALLDPPAVEEAPTGRSEVARKTILIVEDNPHMARLIREWIVQEGDPDWTVQCADAGLRALELAGATPPDVVLLDVYLPDLDGAEVYGRLRECPTTRSAKVLFLSAGTPAELWARGITDGVLLRKPFDLGDLVAILRTLLRDERTDLIPGLERAARPATTE